jgi:hypothetical protein
LFVTGYGLKNYNPKAVLVVLYSFAFSITGGFLQEKYKVSLSSEPKVIPSVCQLFELFPTITSFTFLRKKIVVKTRQLVYK